jgi:hypothetical protein
VVGEFSNGVAIESRRNSKITCLNVALLQTNIEGDEPHISASDGAWHHLFLDKHTSFANIQYTHLHELP